MEPGEGGGEWGGGVGLGGGGSLANGEPKEDGEPCRDREPKEEGFEGEGDGQPCKTCLSSGIRLSCQRPKRSHHQCTLARSIAF